MTKYGETLGYSASDHAKVVKRYLRIEYIDCIIVNNGKPSVRSLRGYEKENSFPVSYNIEELYSLGVKKIIEADVMNRQLLIRHNPERIAEEIIRLIEM